MRHFERSLLTAWVVIFACPPLCHPQGIAGGRVGNAAEGDTPTASGHAQPAKLSLFVIDYSGWRSRGVTSRVSGTVNQVHPDATVVSVGVAEGLPTGQAKNYDITVSAATPNVEALREIIDYKVQKAARGSRQVVVHIDINEEWLPQQVRALFAQLPGKNETRGPGLLGAALLKCAGPKYADVVVRRGHSDGTYCAGYALARAKQVGIRPEMVILESPRETWGTWKGRFKEHPDTLFIAVTADGDLPRKSVVDFGFGRAGEVKGGNYININLEKWSDPKLAAHSAPTEYGETYKNVRVRGWIGGDVVDFGVHDVTLGKLVEAAATEPTSVGQFARAVLADKANPVAYLAGFPETGRDKATGLAEAGVITVWQPRHDKPSKIGVREVDLVMYETGDKEVLGNRGIVTSSVPNMQEALPPVGVSKVFFADHVLECPSRENLPVVLASRLAGGEPPHGMANDVPMWSTTPKFAGPDADIMTSMARSRLAQSSTEAQFVLVVGNDKKADSMAAKLQATGVVVVCLKENLSPEKAERLGQQLGSGAVLRVGPPPAIAVDMNGSLRQAVPKSQGQTGGGPKWVSEPDGDTHWYRIYPEDDPSDVVWVYDGTGQPGTVVADAVDRKAKELCLPAGSKVVVGGDPDDPEYQAAVKVLRDRGYEVVEEHWEEGTLSREEKLQRVHARCRKEGAKLGAITGYVPADADDDSDDDNNSDQPDTDSDVDADIEVKKTALSENGVRLGGQRHEAFGQVDDFSWERPRVRNRR